MAAFTTVVSKLFGSYLVVLSKGFACSHAMITRSLHAQAVKLRQWAVARFAFEAALALNPVHPPALEALLPLLLRLGDWDTAARVADALLAVDPWHPLAGRASDTLAAVSRWVLPFTSERANICVILRVLDCLFLGD